MPEGTSPASAVRQQAAGPQSRGLRLGNITIPWWAVGIGAVGVGLVGFLIYRNMQSQGPSNAAGGSSAGTPMASGVSSDATPTAATLVPLPYPTAGTTSGTTATQASGLGEITARSGNPQAAGGKFPLYATAAWKAGTPFIMANPGTYQLAGAPVTEQGNPYGGGQYPVTFAGQTYYVNAADVTSTNLANTQLAPSAA